MTHAHAVRARDGFAMAALLAAMTIMAIFLSMALPAWHTAAQREKESELIFRGQQYARAITLFQRKYANTFPPNVDVLLNEHFLRKKYKDPITDGDFQLVYANQQQGTAQPSAGGTGVVPTQGQAQQRPATAVGGGGTTGTSGPTVGPQGGIIGVASKSKDTSIRVYNGHDKYNEWVFVAIQASNRAGGPGGTQTPTGGPNFPGGGPAGGIGGGRGGRNGQPQPGERGRGNFPPGQGPGRGFGNPPGPFGQPRGGGGGFGTTPIGPGGVGPRGGGR